MAWKPLRAPQAIVIKISGHIGRLFGLRFAKVRCGYNVYPFTMSMVIRLTAMNTRQKPKMGYILPMILSTGKIVAIK